MINITFFMIILEGRNMKILKLTHIQLLQDYKNEIKDIGYFSNLNKVRETINFYKSLTGFTKYNNSFVISEIYVKNCKNNRLFEAIFYIHNSDYSIEFSEILGVFGRKEDAEKSIQRYIAYNDSFINSNNFEIELIVNNHTIDEPSNWKEGFLED